MSKSSMQSSLVITTLLVVVTMLMPEQAHAAAAGGGGLPWEQGIQMIADSLTGPIAYSLVLIGLVGSVWSVLHGGEITGFSRSMIVVCLCGAALVLAKQVVQQLIGAGALVG